MGKRRAKVLILYTGGTFGMEAETLSVPKLSPVALRQRLSRYVPELALLADCEVRVVMNCDSAHIGPTEWLQLARIIQESWRAFDGIVVLHGTDTMAWTASALSFLLRPCLKPVILTGAQRPLVAVRTDARRNLVSAVELAAQDGRSGLPRFCEVGIFFDEMLFRGNRARKRSALDFAAFESPKAGALARLGSSIHHHDSLLAAGRTARSGRGGGPRLRPAFSSRVAMLHLTPGFPADAVERLLPGLDGLLLVAFPSGTAPTHQADFRKLLASARSLRVPVMVVTEGIGVTGSEYEAGRELLRQGCLWSGAMTPECAYVKASYLLGQENGREVLLKWWGTELANEGVSER